MSKARDHDIVVAKRGGPLISKGGFLVNFEHRTAIAVSAQRHPVIGGYGCRSDKEGDTLLLPKEFLS